MPARAGAQRGTMGCPKGTNVIVTPLADNRHVKRPKDGVAVIGQCVVASCNRPAVTHLVVHVGRRRLAGIVCEHCERATRGAAFLLELRA